ncbi:MAG: tetratricopeptide repeat protein [Armatimonadota bacterium]
MSADLDEEEIQTLLRNTGIFIRRGDWESAESSVLTAVEMSPDDAVVQELLGDVLLGRGERTRAAEAYKRAVEINPGAAEAEIKYARIILGLSEEARLESAKASALEQPVQPGAKPSPIVGLLASMFWPGLGQFYNGDYTKAKLLAGAYGVIMLLLLLTGQLSSLASVFVTLMAPTKAAQNASASISLLAVFLWGGAAAAWLYAIIDAPVQAGKSKKTKASDYSEPDF